MTLRCVVAITVLVSILAGCDGPQSSLAPAGSEGRTIALMGYVLYGGGTAILLLVLLATALAVRGGPSVRALLADHRTILAGGILLPVVVLTALLVWGFLILGNLRAADRAAVTRIEIIGEQWWWRVIYRDAAGTLIATSANELMLPQGRPVDLVLTSSDVIHSFWVPAIAGKLDMIPGRTTTLRLTPTNLGAYRGQCAEYCGGAHALMAFWTIVVPQDEFFDHLQHQATNAAEPASAVSRRGSELFQANGCGACHTIRGTPAAGVVGPDLTHIGSRRSIGAATLPLTRTALAQWIVDSHAVKPEVLMPRFAILDGDQAQAIATYLEGLR